MGRVCDGYGVWGGGGLLSIGNNKVQARLEDKRKDDDRRISYAIAPHMHTLRLPGPCISGQEQLYLEWFIHGTATKTPRIFKSPFWDPIILQLTMHEPMVLQALLALSSAHKRMIMDPANRARDGLLPDTQEMFLLKQYNSAIKNMQTHLAEEGRPSGPKLFIAVVMCALFVLLEYTRGRYDNGHIHLVSGMKMAQELIREPSETKIGVKLIHFFARLQDQMNVFFMLSPGTTSDPTNCQAAPATIPVLRFESIAEAASHLEALIDSLAHSIEQSRLIPLSAQGSRRLLEEEHAYLMASFEAWLLAYEATTADLKGATSPEESVEWTILRQRFATTMDHSDIGIFESKMAYTGDAALRAMANCIAQKGRDRIAGKKISKPVNDIGVAKALMFAGTKWTVFEY